MSKVAFRVDPSGIILCIDGRIEQVAQDHPNYTKVKDAIAKGAFAGLFDLLNMKAVVKGWIGEYPSLTMVGDLLALDGRAFSDAITDKVLTMVDGGYAPSALVNFLTKVRQNPSSTAQDETLMFVTANDFLIHEDGDIIGYKSVREDYTDIYSGQHSNKVGERPEMPRNAVDDNRHKTCSRGFHFAAHEYANSWTSYGHLMVIKVNPADVVSIPSDYNNMKARTCAYSVIGEMERNTKLEHKEVFTSVGIAADENVVDFVSDAEADTDYVADIKDYRQNLKALKAAYKKASKNHKPRKHLIKLIADTKERMKAKFGTVR